MIKEFKNLPNYEKLGERKAGFEFCLNYLNDIQDEAYIVETGTARIKDNWEGDGQSTLVWDWCLGQKPNLKGISIDMSAEFITNARNQTKNMTYQISDSLVALNKMDEDIVRKIKMLYLDSYDWSAETQMDSAFHHFCELASVWRLLPPGCLIMVDDRHSEYQGKHLMVNFFFEKLNKSPVYTGYQIAWVK